MIWMVVSEVGDRGVSNPSSPVYQTGVLTSLNYGHHKSLAH